MRRLEVRVDGVPVWLPREAELRGAIAAQLSGAPQATVRLFTLNPELVMAARRDSAYRQTLAAAEWNLVDGAGLSIALRRRLPRSLLERLEGDGLRHPGADLVYDLAAEAERAGRPLLIIGGAPQRLEKACQRLRELFPRLAVEGFSPRPTKMLPFAEQAELEERILALRPGVIAVCLGAPRQEQWIERSLALLRHADVRIAAALGGTVDFLSGEVKRAPAFVRRAGAEWLFRLLVEPWRWKRQASALPAFALRAVFSPRMIEAGPAPSRVVVYAHYMPPHPSASATRMMSLARFLREEGHEVTLLTSMPGPAMVNGISVARPKGRAGLFSWLVRNPRCPILVSSPPATPAAEVAALARVLGYRVVVDVRDPFVSEALANGDLRPGPRSWIKFRLERLLLGTGHATSLVSQPLLAAMRRLMRLELANASIAPNGVDLDLFESKMDQRDAIRREHGFGDSPVFIYAGILGGKELDKVLDGLAPSLRAGAFLVMLAVVDEHSRPVQEKLRAQADALGVGSRVLWKANLSTDEVAAQLGAADIGINPLPLGRTYCLPVKTFEYLACGVYNLAFGHAEGALAGLLTDPVAGTVTHSWDSFAAAAQRLCASVDEVRRGSAGRRALAAAYDRKTANRTLEGLLLGLPDARRADERQTAS